MTRLRYLLFLVGSTAIALLVVEHVVLPEMEKPAAGPGAPRVKSLAWERDNAVINANNSRFKNVITADDWTWHSAGHPVSVERHTARRILVIGDSFVWGDGYANMNDIWWRQLARELRRRGYAEVEVLGVGRRGAATRDELDQLRRVVPKYQPDLVIMDYVTNDADQGHVKLFDYATLERDPVVRFHVRLSTAGILPRLNFQLAQLRRDKVLGLLSGAESGWKYGDWERKLVEPGNLKFYQATVQELGAYVGRSGTPFFVVTTPNIPSRTWYEPLHAPVLPIFARNHVRMYDLLDDFMREFGALSRANHNILWTINPANGHPGVLATHFFAVQTADILERDYPALLGPRTPPPAAFSPEINDWLPANLAFASRAPSRVTFTYPSRDDWMIRMPVGRPHVMFALAMPAKATAVRVSGPSLASAEIYLTRIDPHYRCDLSTLAVLPWKQGGDLVWQLNPATSGKDLNTLRLIAWFRGPNRTLTLEIVQ